jgi:hypothetical protein
MDRQPAAGDTAASVAVVVIALWTEPGADGTRARVTRLRTLDSDLEVSVVTTSVRDALEVACDWLMAAATGAATRDVTPR